MDKAKDIYHNTYKMLALTSLLALSACGGGGGGGGDSSSDNGLLAGDDGEVVSDQPVVTPIDSTSTADFLSARVQAIMVPLHPAPGIEDGRHTSFGSYDVNASGNIIASGGFSTPDNMSIFSRAIWTGPPADLQLLISTEDPESPLSAPIPIGQFSGVTEVSIADDGTLGILVPTTNADGRFAGSAYLMREPDSSLLTPVLSESVVLPTSTGSPVLNEILGEVKLSSGGIAFAADVDNDERGLWTYANGTVALVAPGGDPRIVAPLLLPGTDCRITFTDSLGSNPFAIDNTGSIVFRAILAPITEDSDCFRRSAIMRYTAGEYEVLVSSGQIAPGYSDAFVTASIFQDIFPNGDALIDLRMNRTGTIGFNSEFLDSTWRFPKAGAPSLIVLDGESVNTDQGALLLNGDSIFNVGANQEIALRINFTGITGGYLFGAPHRVGQPYSQLSDTGASDLRFLARDNGAAPVQFPNTHVFDNLGVPEPDGEGNYYFFGEVHDELDGDVVEEAIWRADAGGSIESIVSDGDLAVVSDGTVQTITDIRARNRNGDGEQIEFTSSGTMIVLAETSGSILNLIPIVVQLER